jgi:Fe(3+) dicitrate transport protein
LELILRTILNYILSMESRSMMEPIRRCRMHVATGLLVLACTIPGRASAQEAGDAIPTGVVRGVVSASEDADSPLDGVAVELVEVGRRTVSDEDGRFRFASVPVGRHTLRLSVVGRAVLERRVEVTAGAVTRERLTLEAAPVALAPMLVLQSRTRLSEGIDRELVPGSLHVIGSRSLRDRPVVFDDVHALLRQVPGVNVQEEDGYGLRPNIGMRGTGVERSSKITVMEDGVLAAPAPYAAPAAYYFPVAGRMSAIEVRKGSSQIRYGPNTIGGALNLVSSPIPSAFSVMLDAAAGSDASQKIRARAGDSERHFGWMVEGYRSRTDGFKELDGGGATGFDVQDYLGKFRLNSDLDASTYQDLELKVGWYDEESNETYLGLTDSDFALNPNRRYAASQLDLMDADHQMANLRHFVRFPSGVDLTTTAYFNAFARNWYKLQSVDGTGISTVLGDPDTYATELAVLRGAADSEDGLAIRANNREYLSRGIQTALRLSIGDAVTHQVELGVRVHGDEEDRFQQEDDYGISGGRMFLAEEGAPGSQANRVSTATAVALHLQDRIRSGRFTVSPGLRFETIDFTRTDFEAGDASRAVPAGVRENSITAWIPGVGAAMDVSSDATLFAGVHRGFGPPGPGADEETRAESSVNYELGLRVRRGAASLELTGFYSDYDNILGRATLATGESGTNEIFNGGEVRAAGLELTASADPLDGSAGAWRLPVQLTYTLTEATFRSAFESDFGPWGTVEVGDHLPYVPRHQLFVSAGLEKGPWSGRVATTASSAVRTVAGQGDIPSSERTDSFVVLAAGLDYELSTDVTAYAAVENLTDTHYVVARRPAGVRPGLPRTLQVGVRFTR